MKSKSEYDFGEVGSHADRPMTSDTLIRKAFDAYNRRNAVELITMVSDDVRWPGNGCTLRGKAEVQRYLEDQWAETVTFDEVLAVDGQGDGYVIASLDQVVRSLDGETISTARLKYGFVVEHGKIAELRTRNA